MSLQLETATTSILDRPAPTLRVHAADGAGLLTEALLQAVDVLVDAGRVRPARPGQRPDLLHTVGDLDAPVPGPGGLHRVHTVDRVALRGDRQLLPTRRWSRRNRQYPDGCTAFVTHGHTAARVLVESGLAPGGRVHCLPVLPPWPLAGVTRSAHVVSAARLTARRGLGLRPGVRLVVGTCSSRPSRVDAWPAALGRLGRRDVQVLTLPSDPDLLPTCRPAGLPLPALLDAADLFVAASRELTAVSSAAGALAVGLPVVAVATDSAAELVTSGRDGQVVASRVDAVVDAVVDFLDGVAPWGLAGHRVTVHRPVEDLAARLLSVYDQALARPAL